MRKLSKSESRLFLFFAAAIFLAANLLGMKFWMSTRQRLVQQETSLRGQIDEDKSWIAAAADFNEAAAWLAANKPPAFTSDGASTDLIDSVRKSAESNSLSIATETLLPATAEFTLPHASLQIKLTGPFPGIVRLLFDLQKPGAWRTIDKLTLRSDATPPNALAEMQIRQYYSTDQPSPAIQTP
jgi:hypothetical protein